MNFPVFEEGVMLPVNHTLITLIVILFSVGIVHAQKNVLDTDVRANTEAAWKMAHKIWEFAEVGYKEKQSSAILADSLEAAGFKVERGVANIPTAFTATIGSGKPVIALLGEYDALPGMSQEAVPYKQPRKETSTGHGCGHHMFGVAAVMACKGLATQIRNGKIKGTLRFYGCPAEEGGSGKAFMVRAGLFDDCDIVLHWHPASQNTIGDPSCLARMAVKFRFHGTSAHAAAAPEEGRSALGAVELTDHAANILRQHTPDLTRIHHVVTHGGGAPNVVPDFAETFYYIRHPKADTLRQLYPRLVKCAEGAAIATETKLETLYLGGTLEILPNETLAKAVEVNMKKLNDLKYDADELKFAVRIRDTLAKPIALESIAQVEHRGGGIAKDSTDVGDVSWVVPTTGFTAACWVPGTPMHSWQAVATGGMSIGRKGMELAGRTLAATAWDCFTQPELIVAAKAELRQRIGAKNYHSLIPKDLQPPLDYRDPPKR